MARPPEQSNLVDPLEGSDEAKRRLKVVLQTITGERSIADACERLDISATTLFEYRTRALLGALAGLTPGAPGRPSNATVDPVVTELRAKVAQLEQALMVEQTRTQLALHTTTPGLTPVAAVASKKKQPPQ